MFKNRLFKKILKLLLALALLSVIGLSITVYLVIHDLKLKINESNFSSASIVHSKSKIEADAGIRKSELKNFLLFSESKYKKNQLQKLESSGVLEIEKNKVSIKKTFELPRLRTNNCKRYRCVQNKLDFTELPAPLWKALLGTEDFRFLDHRGVDPVAILRAIVVDIMAMKFVQGGSTLTQQLVKNLYLTSERKLSRKIKEVISAIYIEQVLEKEEIITLYLNVVYWGSFQGIYLKGANAASLAYFDKSPYELSEFEATILISLLKGPSFYNPIKRLDRLKTRATAVYKRLKGLNLVSSDESDMWTDEKWENWGADYAKRNKQTYFFTYYLTTKSDGNNLEPFEKFVLFNSIYKIKNRYKRLTGDADIAVKVMVVDKNCDSYDCENAFSFYSKLERETRKAITSEYHQIGSLLKPLIYDAFIELGRNYNEMISTKPLTLKLKSGPWSPKDYSKAKIEEISLKMALQKSKNIPLIRVADEVGFDKLEEVLDGAIPRLKTPLGEYPSQLLGALELSLEEVFQVYGNFITNKCESVNEGEIALEDTALFFMGEAHKTTISKIAKGALREANVFGKTGTSNNGLDNWFYAYDGLESYVIWFGVDSKRKDLNLHLSGGATSFRIFQDFMNNRGKQISEVFCD